MNTQRSANGQIAYTRRGMGRPLVLVHGVGASARSWDVVARQLEADYDVIAMDLRGHGQSAKVADLPSQQDWTIDDFSKDILSLMDEIGVDRAALAGFSLGGLIAQRLCLVAPERFDDVVILSAVAGRTEEERARVLSRLDVIRAEGVKGIVGAATDRWFTANFALEHPGQIKARMAELQGVDVPSYLQAYRVFGQTELIDELHKITARCLVMTGEFDPGSNTRMARDMQARIPNATLKILPGLRHSVLVEAPELIAREIRSFLEKKDEEASAPSDLFSLGLAQRRATVGDAYVDAALRNVTDFSADFQRYITEYCWGEGWGDHTLSARQRSMINVAMLAGINRMHEWELHFRGALNNGVTLDELAAIIKQITIYCGVPAGVECHRIAHKVLTERGLV